VCSKKFKQAEKGDEEKQLSVCKKTTDFHMSNAERKIISLQHVQNKHVICKRKSFSCPRHNKPLETLQILYFTITYADMNDSIL